MVDAVLILFMASSVALFLVMLFPRKDKRDLHKEIKQGLDELSNDRLANLDYVQGKYIYRNICTRCKKTFAGHKRRIICMKCDAPVTDKGTLSPDLDV